MSERLNKLHQNWNTDYMSSATFVPSNAQMFGLVIIDFDNTLKTRITAMKTSDLEIPFQHIEEIPGWDKSANYEEQTVVGRFEPATIYSSSSAQEISITLIYNAEAKYNTNAKTPWTLENIEQYQKRLQSLMYPYYYKGFSAPSKVKLNIGNIFCNVPMFVKSVKIKNEAPFDFETGLPFTRKISLDLRVAYPSWQAISADKIFVEKAGNRVFAYQSINERNSSSNMQSKQSRINMYRNYLNKPEGK